MVDRAEAVDRPEAAVDTREAVLDRPEAVVDKLAAAVRLPDQDWTALEHWQMRTAALRSAYRRGCCWFAWSHSYYKNWPFPATSV